MANVDAAYGFNYVGDRNGGFSQAKPYFIPASDSTAVFIGSPVKMAGSGSSPDGYPTVALAADTDKPVGVVVGVDQARGITAPNLKLYQTHRPASVGMFVYVIDNPEALFKIQADDDSATLAAADIGLNCGFTAESGDATFGRSTIELDTSDKATTSTLPLKIERIFPQSGNEAYVAQQQVLVSFNLHHYKTGYDTGATAEIGGLGV